MCVLRLPFSSGCAESDAFGNYLILGLAAASFEVEAFSTDENQNLVGTSYPGLVAVPAAGEVAGINIALQPGGQIEGTVRLASTGAPVAGVDVCVTEADLTWSLGCLKTPASGGYRFYGLWTGSFKVAFSPEASEFAGGEQWEIAPDSFPTQWWNGKPYFETATPIGITFPGEVVGGIDGSLGPGPVVSPPATVPSTPPAATVVKPKPKPTPKPLRCKPGFAKKKVKGKVRCVKRHKSKHHRRHHPKPRRQAARSR